MNSREVGLDSHSLSQSFPVPNKPYWFLWTSNAMKETKTEKKRKKGKKSMVELGSHGVNRTIFPLFKLFSTVGRSSRSSSCSQQLDDLSALHGVNRTIFPLFKLFSTVGRSSRSSSCSQQLDDLSAVQVVLNNWTIFCFNLAVLSSCRFLWFDSALDLLSLQKGCGLWTLSCDFVPHNYETLKWLSS